MIKQIWLEPMQFFWEHITGNENELRRIENYWRLYAGWGVIKQACTDGVRQEIAQQRNRDRWDWSLFA